MLVCVFCACFVCLLPQFKNVMYLTNYPSTGEIPTEGKAGCNIIQHPDQSTTNLKVRLD